MHNSSNVTVDQKLYQTGGSDQLVLTYDDVGLGERKKELQIISWYSPMMMDGGEERRREMYTNTKKTETKKVDARTADNIVVDGVGAIGKYLKSGKHLLDQISLKMRERGFDRYAHHVYRQVEELVERVPGL
ncbi:hypothetical protein L2E82_25420 [Cichorium intybus]|uniref:Uncharacterized protein n=1 Tax=Cichorium intybus TaxID=13427 RepID=A0ACB9E2Z5_CICIN|nr:hypothetical protein L2E82_25420 [Cichorium intybus]